MKLSGNKKDGRYAGGRARGAAAGVGEPNGPAKSRKRRAARTLRVLTVVALAFVALSAILYSVYRLGVRPPEIKQKQPRTSPGVTEGSSPAAVSGDRVSRYVYTFVILGFDDGNGNTDTIMVANFDASTHTLNVVSIPRDTLVNVPWSVKKANTLYSSGGGIDGVIKGLANILGFEVDYYVIVDLKAFSELVDAVGGVDFEVPRDMNYEDPAQDLYIHLKKGMQHLDGKSALQLVRCRSVYANADIGRIETQQKFLKAAIEQILQKQDKLNITEIVKIFLKYVKTNLGAGDLIWFAKEFYKMDSENISFATIPGNYTDSINGSSYVTIYVDEWLKLLNEKINPYKQDIKAEDLSILTRDSSGKLYVTNGVWAGKKTWGSKSSGSSSSGGGTKPSASPSGGGSSDGAGAPTSPKPSQTPSPTPSPSPSPSPSSSPSPSAGVSPSPSPSTGPTDSPSPSTDGGVEAAPSGGDLPAADG